MVKSGLDVLECAVVGGRSGRVGVPGSVGPVGFLALGRAQDRERYDSTSAPVQEHAMVSFGLLAKS